MKVAIVGFGSIGQRHSNLFKERGIHISVVSHSINDKAFPVITLEKAILESDVIWICNETSKHFGTMEAVLNSGFRGSLLVEKPVFHKNLPIEKFKNSRVFVTYNLRFHPCLMLLKEHLQNSKEKILALNAYVGQYLPSWRPDRDYRESYSAHKEMGGGCLRDLSHELDFINWLCGYSSALTAVGGKISDLEIESDDYFSILMTGRNYPVVSVTLNYLDRVRQRNLILQTTNGSYYLDFVKGSLRYNDTVLLEDVPMLKSYQNQISNILNGNWHLFTTLEEAHFTMRMIDACERSSRDTNWVQL